MGGGVLQADPDVGAEFDKALSLKPDLENGRKVYLTCAVCHGPEAWGSPDGYYPQIAGQMDSVIIKQLADIRARNRDNPTMYPFSKPSVLGGPQEIADVTAYIANLPMTPQNSVGPGHDLERGEALYRENCVDCHGDRGQGNQDEHVPLIQGQHYRYLVRQFEWIRNSRRRNSDSKMVKQIRGFSHRDVRVVMDYVSRLRPAEEKLAKPGWLNPDFPNFVRRPMSRTRRGPTF
jgi:cytochrome c553